MRYDKNPVELSPGYMKSAAALSRKMNEAAADLSPLGPHVHVFNEWKAQRDRSGVGYSLYTGRMLRLMRVHAKAECSLFRGNVYTQARKWSGLLAIDAEIARREVKSA